MNGRERYAAVYGGGTADRLPISGIDGWAETLARWHGEGLDADQTPTEALGLASDETLALPLHLGMVPAFSVRVLAETERFVALVDECGVTKRMLRADFERSGGRKDAAGQTSSMSQWIDFPVKDVRSWKTIFEERFRPAANGRIPAEWPDERRAFGERAASRWVISFPFPFGGLFSAVRELMGLEGALFALSDDPALVRTIVGDLCRFYLDSFSLLVPEARLDQVVCFEDMCSSSAPLISPAAFREFFALGYRRYIGGLRDLGVQHVFMDTDGDARLIIPDLIACGFTGIQPCEVKAGMDAEELRRAHPGFCLCGGIDKRALARGGDAIDEELARRFRTAWDRGRYAPALDHGAPPDISWTSIRHYARRYASWCRDPRSMG